ncbi:MAG TPA: epoxide hydrolase [Acidimicrobiales bacterium]|nr:epoxide hydrolase [Acidimicrobiales bacterium]
MSQPFAVHVDDAEVEELRRRLGATRWPSPAPGGGWDYGTDVEWLRDLCAYWGDAFDWRAQEQLLNAFPQVLVRVGGLDIHCVHVRGRGPRPMPLVATHGWPSSFFEFTKVIDALADPGSHGGDPHDAFDVVVPSLPGYGFSSAPDERGMSAARVADLWADLMSSFGYTRFASHGGDWGAAVTTALGTRHPERMIGLHLTMAAPPVLPSTLTPHQREWWDGVQAYRDREWGYVHLQRTKPQTPAFALTDSPAGLAAWVLEKWWRWSDCGDEGGERDLWRVYTRDELLTTVSIYWFTRSIGPSMRMYYESFGPGSTIAQPHRVEVPTGLTLFRDPNAPPRELVEPWYDLRYYATIDRGGHFPALENPGALVREIREFFRPLRASG